MKKNTKKLPKIKEKDMHQSMRGIFCGYLYNAMIDNPNIIVITGDLGYGQFDKIKSDFPGRFINAGAREQAMLGLAVGMSYKGKIPFVYSITPFLLARGYEWLRNYVNFEGLNIKLMGGGRDLDYGHDGFTHHSQDAKSILDTLSDIDQYWPELNSDIKDIVNDMIENNTPSFVSLRR